MLSNTSFKPSGICAAFLCATGRASASSPKASVLSRWSARSLVVHSRSRPSPGESAEFRRLRKRSAERRSSNPARCATALDEPHERRRGWRSLSLPPGKAAVSGTLVETSGPRPCGRVADGTRIQWMPAWPVPRFSAEMHGPRRSGCRSRCRSAGTPLRERPGRGQCWRVSPACTFRGHRATSTAGFDLVRRCRFVRPPRPLGYGSRRGAWRGSRRRGWRRCSGSARGLARSRGCSCRLRVA